MKLGGKKGVEVDLRSFRMRSEVVFVRDGKESKEMEGWNGGWRLLWPIYRHCEFGLLRFCLLSVMEKVLMCVSW